MKIFNTRSGIVVEQTDTITALADVAWDELFMEGDLQEFLLRKSADGMPVSLPGDCEILPVVDSQEIWAAGVTYRRSRTARMEESQKAGGGNFYDMVYEAERPELFFKGSKRNVVGHRQNVHIRVDSTWNVPEPELTIAVSNSGSIIGFTIGNDMSSRDIEGENPLYLPQAKVYDRSCALGPCLLVGSNVDEQTEIDLSIERSGEEIFSGNTSVSAIKRKLSDLVEYLFRENTFSHGCYLMTGTGVVPPDSFTLAAGDRITIAITGIGVLINNVD